MTKVITFVASILFASSAMAAIEFSEDQLAASAATLPETVALPTAKPLVKSPVGPVSVPATSQPSTLGPGAGAAIAALTPKTFGGIGSGMAGAGMIGGGGGIGGGSNSESGGPSEPLTGAIVGSEGTPMEKSAGPGDGNPTDGETGSSQPGPSVSTLPEPSGLLVWSTLALAALAVLRRRNFMNQ